MQAPKFLFPVLLVMSLALTLACTIHIPGNIPTPTVTPLPTNTPVPTDTPIPTPTPIAYDGEWKGTTSQSMDISFTVVDNSIASIAIKAELKGPGCTSTMESTGTFTAPYPIEDGTFTISNGGGDVTYTFTGAFTSPESASGTLEYLLTGGCSGTIKVDWIASRAAQ